MNFNIIFMETKIANEEYNYLLNMLIFIKEFLMKLLFVWIVNGRNYGHAEATIQIHEYLALKFDYECAEATKNFWRKATLSPSLSLPLPLREFRLQGSSGTVYDNLWLQSLHVLDDPRWRTTASKSSRANVADATHVTQSILEWAE